ncbi:MAG: energy transducer TonB [Pseudomonadota bacterium]|nr:energy transducer TonB [Pseudomonadota bacterium]
MTSPDYAGMRGRRDDRLSRPLILSLLVHLMLLSLAILLPIRPATPRFTIGPVYSVNLVSVSDGILGRRPAADPLQDLADTVLPTTGSRAIKKSVPMETPPIRRVDARRHSTSPAVEKLRKKLDEKTPTALGATSPASSAAAGGQIDDRLADYYRVVWSRIKGQWALPGGISPRKDVEAVVNIRILKDGSIVGMTFEKRSGLAYFDNSVLRALKKAHPLPPPPAWLRENDLEIGIRFLSSDLR